ncbi:peptidase inhibitor family I36 protein [Streptomyces sp. NPDC002133]|uniref:peptidase inhibitor family I36 protein n=1 Tax=Streptomyces sp. NPDC002133 TaxID=3154409 RepID=UPI00332A77BE
MRTTVLAAALAATALLAPTATATAAATATANATATVTATPRPVLGACGPGELCLWPKPGFVGAAQSYELSGLDIDSCVTLPTGTTAQSLANRTGRPVTTYQSAECAETGEFETYPGSGTWVPQSPYKVRAFKVWEN